MVSNESISTLLQVVALALPAVGIYLQVLVNQFEELGLDKLEEATVHQTQLAIISLSGSGSLLLIALLAIELMPSPRIIRALWILSVLSLIFGLGMFGLSAIYWSMAAHTRSTLLWGLYSPITRIFANPEADKIRILEILSTEGSRRKQTISDSIGRPDDYVLDLINELREGHYVDVHDRGGYRITKEGEEYLKQKNELKQGDEE